MNTEISDDMVSRFLTWPVPADVYTDGAPGQPGRTGTNLLNAQQAKEMLAHVLGTEENPVTRGWCAAYPGSAAWIINELGRHTDAMDAELVALRADYENACKLVADMHAAAMGGNFGPAIGVVEDIAALRAERDSLDAALLSVLRNLRQWHEEYKEFRAFAAELTNAIQRIDTVRSGDK